MCRMLRFTISISNNATELLDSCCHFFSLSPRSLLLCFPLRSFYFHFGWYSRGRKLYAIVHSYFLHSIYFGLYLYSCHLHSVVDFMQIHLKEINTLNGFAIVFALLQSTYHNMKYTAYNMKKKKKKNWSKAARSYSRSHSTFNNESLVGPVTLRVCNNVFIVVRFFSGFSVVDASFGTYDGVMKASRWNQLRKTAWTSIHDDQNELFVMVGALRCETLVWRIFHLLASLYFTFSFTHSSCHNLLLLVFFLCFFIFPWFFCCYFVLLFVVNAVNRPLLFPAVVDVIVFIVILWLIHFVCFSFSLSILKHSSFIIVFVINFFSSSSFVCLSWLLLSSPLRPLISIVILAVLLWVLSHEHFFSLTHSLVHSIFIQTLFAFCTVIYLAHLLLLLDFHAYKCLAQFETFHTHDKNQFENIENK